MNLMSISVVINTYNAELRLRRVLETVRDFDEVVICDMESSDGTLEIAREFGCKIVTFPKGDCKSAEPARTFAIQSASSEWVLVVDADELVTPELRTYLYAQTQRPDCPAGIYIPRKNHMFGLFVKSSYPDYQLRFFRREGTVWPPFVHTFPTVQGPTERIPKNRKELAFIHLADDPENKYVSKLNDYSDNEAVRRQGKRVGLLKLMFSPFFRFFKSYVIKGGFRLGKFGFIMSCNDAFYKFLVLAKMVERDEKKIMYDDRGDSV